MSVMVVERVDADTGEVFSTDRTDRHGWGSPEEAVAYWRHRAGFTRYLNGRQHEAQHGVVVRVHFEDVTA